MPDFFDDVPGDPDAPYLFLDFVSDRGRWTPSGGAATDVASYKLKFETLVKGGTAIDGSNNCQDLMRIVPDHTPDTFDARGRTQNGFKFEWVGTDGSRWTVHAHEPDHEAPNKSLSSRNWIARIRYVEAGSNTIFWMRNSLEPAKQINKTTSQPARSWVPDKQANKHPTHIEILNVS
jgi:hypothetical protein